MGLEPITILTLIFGSAATVELVKCLHTWIQMRRPKARIRLTLADSEVELDAENLPDLKELISNVLAMMKESGGG